MAQLTFLWEEHPVSPSVSQDSAADSQTNEETSPWSTAGFFNVIGHDGSSGKNVPGVLSSNGGRDFGSIFGAMAELGYSFAWRVLDAQYFGVPQRRRRVFLVGHSGDVRYPAEVLFEPGCMRRDLEKGGKQRSDIANCVGTGFGSRGGASGMIDAAQGNHLVASTGRIAHCLNAGGMGRQDYETETMVVAFDTTQITHPKNGSNPMWGDPCHTLPKHGHAPSIAFSGRDRGDDGRGYGREPNVTGPITETVDATKPPRVAGPTTGVRRLTPLECERLQGFPDDWTLVPHRGKLAADGPRYKAIGNSMAVPVMRWIGQRIIAVHQ